MSSTSSSSSGSDGDGAYIEHQVTKFDTLAGVAIKYGVEVSDIKKMNGLVNDLQMFGLKSLRIPLPGRHTASRTSDASGSSWSKTSAEHALGQVGLFGIHEPLRIAKVKSSQHISPAMSHLQNYYSLKSTSPKVGSDVLEMKFADLGILGDDIKAGGSFPSRPVSNGHHKTRSLGNGFLSGKAIKDFPTAEAADWGNGGFDEQLFHNWEKTETDMLPCTPTPEKILKTHAGSGSSSFSPITGKGLALRPKSASRTNLAADAESGSGMLTSTTSGMSDLFAGDDEIDNGGNSVPIWSNTRWSLKPEILSIPTPSIPKPLLNGLRNKAAKD
ncbi:unnamed protein product [Rhodiola kirilowii]